MFGLLLARISPKKSWLEDFSLENAPPDTVSGNPFFLLFCLLKKIEKMRPIFNSPGNRPPTTMNATALTGLNLASNGPNLDSNVKSMSYDKLFEARLALNASEHTRIAADRSTSRFISVRKAEAEAAMTLDDRMRRWSVQDFWAYETANSDWYHENFDFSAWFKRVNAAEAAEVAFMIMRGRSSMAV